MAPEGTSQRDPRRDSRGERSPWLPLETRPDSPGALQAQPPAFAEHLSLAVCFCVQLLRLCPPKAPELKVDSFTS